MATTPTRILGIPGSLRKQSYNRGALEALSTVLPQGATLEIFDIGGFSGFSEDDEKNPPAKVVEFKKKILEADALVFATPEYNYSISGVLKNAIDWASRPYGESAWGGKPAAIIGATVGTVGTARAQYHLRQIFVTLDIHALNKPEVLISNASEKFDTQGKLTDEKTKEHLRKLGSSLVQFAQKMKAGRSE